MREKGQRERMVLVKIKGKEYKVPLRTREAGKLLMITECPTNQSKLLIWRKEEDTPHTERGRDFRIVLEKGLPTKEEILTGVGSFAGIMRYRINEELGTCDIYDFYVVPRLRRKKIGSALREIVLAEAKDRRLSSIRFPLYKGRGERKFFEARGFMSMPPELYPGISTVGAFAGNVKELGVRTGKIGLKVFWAKSARPRLKR